jgi:hypothetical protein
VDALFGYYPLNLDHSLPIGWHFFLLAQNFFEKQQMAIFHFSKGFHANPIKTSRPVGRGEL